MSKVQSVNDYDSEYSLRFRINHNIKRMSRDKIDPKNW